MIINKWNKRIKNKIMLLKKIIGPPAIFLILTN